MGVVGVSVSGWNTEDLDATATKTIVSIGSNQAFKVTEIIITNTDTANTARVEFYDEAASSSPTATAQKLPEIRVPPGETVRIEFKDGPVFTTEVSARAVAGTVAAYDCMVNGCLLYTSPSPRDRTRSRMPSSA